MLSNLFNLKGDSSRYAALSVLLLLPSIFTACSGSNYSPSRARANVVQTVQVTIAPALRQDLPIYLTGLGSIEAYYTVSLKSRVDGQLIDVKFKEGETVKKGALLAVIDPRPYQVQLDQAQAQLFKDQATLRDAKLNYQRYKDLLQNSGAMSQQQVDTQQATVDQLEGTVRNDQATVESAKLNLVYCHITAPVNGRIGLRLVDPGNIVHASDANPMLVITELQPITAVVSLPEDQLPTVAQPMRKGTLEGDACSRADVTIPVTQGNRSAIASGVSPNELVVTDGQDKLQQGSYVEPHTQGSGIQNTQGASSDQNAANAPQNPNPSQGQNGRRGKNGNQRGTASQ